MEEEMKIISQDPLGKETVTELRFERTLHEPGAGWDTIKMRPSIYVDDEKKFEGTEVDATGCSYARRNANQKMVRECFDWILTNMIQ